MGERSLGRSAFKATELHIVFPAFKISFFIIYVFFSFSFMLSSGYILKRWSQIQVVMWGTERAIEIIMVSNVTLGSAETNFAGDPRAH